MGAEAERADVPEPELDGHITDEQHARFRWGAPIGAERQEWLRGLADRQRRWIAQPEATRGDSAFKGVRLTGADVFWLAAYALAGTRADAETLVAKQRALRNPGGSVDLNLSALLLQDVWLWRAQLQDAWLRGARLQGAILLGAQLQGAALAGAQLQGAILNEAQLQGAVLDHARLQGAFLTDAYLQGSRGRHAQLQGADLRRAQLQGADLRLSELRYALLTGAQLQGATIHGAGLQRANLQDAWLLGANLSGARMDSETELAGVLLDTRTRVADVVWNDAPLTQVNWQQAPRLGDETFARQSRDDTNTPKGTETREREFAAAVRANRVLAATLRGQGMHEDADRYAYRAQVLQRQVLRRHGRRGRAFGSWLLDAVAGYGYKPIRSVFTYALVVATFAAVYVVLGGTHGPLTWNEALVVSMTAFHGRGFFGSAFQPSDPQAAVAAVEALVGLLSEITFIATFARRFFAR